MSVLFYNFCMYFAYTVFSFKKWKHATFHNLIAAWFTFIAFIGCYVVYSGDYQNIYGTILKFPMEPYIFAFIAFLIFIWPFRSISIHIDKASQIQILHNKQFEKFIRIILYILLLYAIVLFRSALFTLQFDGKEAYESLHAEGETLYQYSSIESFIIGISVNIYSLFAPVILLYSFWGLMSENCKKKRFYYLSIILILLITFLKNIASGARGGIFFFSITTLFMVLPFYRNFPSTVQKRMVSIALYIGAFFLLYVIGQTISRFGQGGAETPIGSILRYLGEPFPNLGNIYWEKVNVHPLGARMYPFIFQSGTAQNSAQSLADSHTLWEWITGVPILVYKTIYGDFYVEFGKWLAFVPILIYALYMKVFTLAKKVNLANVAILFYFLEIAATAPFFFQKRDFYNVRMLLFMAISYAVIMYILKRKK